MKIFLWLAFKRRHWTGDSRVRHGLEARELCYLYDQGQETIDHILSICPLSRESLVLHPKCPRSTATTASCYNTALVAATMLSLRWRPSIMPRLSVLPCLLANLEGAQCKVLQRVDIKRQRPTAAHQSGSRSMDRGQSKGTRSLGVDLATERSSLH